jgi:dynein heavy chain
VRCVWCTTAGEESRWTLQSKEFDAQIKRLTGDCAVASAFVSYLGPFNKEFRELLMSRDFYQDCITLNIPVTQNIEVRLGTTVIWAYFPAKDTDSRW